MSFILKYVIHESNSVYAALPSRLLYDHHSFTLVPALSSGRVPLMISAGKTSSLVASLSIVNELAPCKSFSKPTLTVMSPSDAIEETRLLQRQQACKDITPDGAPQGYSLQANATREVALKSTHKHSSPRSSKAMLYQLRGTHLLSLTSGNSMSGVITASEHDEHVKLIVQQLLVNEMTYVNKLRVLLRCGLFPLKRNSQAKTGQLAPVVEGLDIAINQFCTVWQKCSSLIDAMLYRLNIPESTPNLKVRKA